MSSTRPSTGSITISPVHDSADSFTYTLPPRPNPAEGAGLILKLSPGEERCPSPNSLDVFTIGPIVALKLLCAGIEALVKITGDVPPTPPPDFTTPPNMRGMQAEKESIVRSNSYKNLAELHTLPRTPSSSKICGGSGEIDGVNFKKRAIRSPEIKPTQPHIIIGDNAEPLNIQHSAITRKFYSKHPPAISLEDYLMRMHQFCPMSTAVFLATSLYIHKLAVDERAIPVTRRNCHRLLLAGLRVAMKALEDMSYPHSRFAKVGGVSEGELGRLEISFCFLTNFDFKTSKEALLEHALNLKEISSLQGAVNYVPRMPLKSKKRTGVGVQEVVKEVTADA